MAENILPHVGGEHLAAALKLLPDPTVCTDATRSVDYEIMPFGVVRITCERKTSKHGRFRQWFWTPCGAEVVNQGLRTNYLDTSALVRLLVDEPGSEALRSYYDRHSVFAVTGICFAECLGVLKTKRRHKLLDDEQYFSAGDDLIARIRDGSIFIDDSTVRERELFDKAERFAKLHKIDLADAYQLIALQHGPFSSMAAHVRLLLITADKDLAGATRSEGLLAWYCLGEPAPS